MDSLHMFTYYMMFKVHPSAQPKTDLCRVVPDSLDDALVQAGRVNASHSVHKPWAAGKTSQILPRMEREKTRQLGHSTKNRVSINRGLQIPNSWLVYNGKSQL